MRGARTLTALIAASVMCAMTTTSFAGEKKDIVDTAVAAGKFNTLAAALKAGGLVDALKGKGPFTVFAPTDDAFAKLPKEAIAGLLKPEAKDTLVSILKFHVVAGAVKSDQVVNISAAPTLNGQRAGITVKDGTVTVAGAKVTAVDIECSNGVIHVIDSVMMPSTDNIAATATKAGKFKTLLAAAKAAGLVDALTGDQPLTVFAPTDEAFASLPAGTVENLLKPENRDQLKKILLYHVVSGRVYADQVVKLKKAGTLAKADVMINAGSDGVRVNKSKVVATDIETSNGVIHVIDAVLLPPAKKDVSASEHVETIRHAINHGSRLYNAGHVSSCASHYMTTVSGLIEDGGETMPPAALQHLHTAMRHARGTTCVDSRSWTLRRGLDGAYRTMMAQAH